SKIDPPTADRKRAPFVLRWRDWFKCSFPCERFPIETCTGNFAEAERDIDQLDGVALCLERVRRVRCDFWYCSGLVGAASRFDSWVETGRTWLDRIARAGPDPTRIGDSGIRDVFSADDCRRSFASQFLGFAQRPTRIQSPKRDDDQNKDAVSE